MELLFLQLTPLPLIPPLVLHSIIWELPLPRLALLLEPVPLELQILHLLLPLLTLLPLVLQSLLIANIVLPVTFGIPLS